MGLLIRGEEYRNIGAMEKMYLGLIGQNGAGKSSVCTYLISKGFKVYSLSDIVRSWIAQHGGALDRDTLIETSNQLKLKYGSQFFAEETFKQAEALERVCFDSVRHPEEVRFLKEKGTAFIGIEADPEIRYKRVLSRGKETDHIEYDTFLRQDKRELSGESSGQNIGECLEQCRYTINNNGSYEDLTQAIDKILDQIKGDVCQDSL